MWSAQFDEGALWCMFSMFGPWIVSWFPTIEHFATQKTSGRILFACCAAPIKTSFGHLKIEIKLNFEQMHRQQFVSFSETQNTAETCRVNRKILPFLCYTFDGHWMATLRNFRCDSFQGNSSDVSRLLNSWRRTSALCGLFTFNCWRKFDENRREKIDKFYVSNPLNSYRMNETSNCCLSGVQPTSRRWPMMKCHCLIWAAYNMQPTVNSVVGSMARFCNSKICFLIFY